MVRIEFSPLEQRVSVKHTIGYRRLLIKNQLESMLGPAHAATLNKFHRMLSLG